MFDGERVAPQNPRENRCVFSELLRPTRVVIDDHDFSLLDSSDQYIAHRNAASPARCWMLRMATSRIIR